MKERIKQLGAEALSDTAKEFNSRIGFSSKDWCEFYDKRFAELILNECFQFIEKESSRLCEYQNSLPRWEENKREDCDLAIEKCLDINEGLKQYFGLEK